MSTVATLVEQLWREGVGPDDRLALASVMARRDEPAIAGDPALPHLRVFAAWFDLLGESRSELPPAPADMAGMLVHAAAAAVHARLDGDRQMIDDRTDALALALRGLATDDPHAVAVRAWAELAFGDVALALGDVRAAKRHFEAATAREAPVAVRLAAMLKLVGAAMSSIDVAPARTWARKATTLAELAKRPEAAARARVTLGMLDYVSGDPDAMRRSLGAQLASPTGGALARIFLANVEAPKIAMPLLADGLREAVAANDFLGYTLFVLVGSRRYAAIGRDGDAIVTLSTGIVQLAEVAPYLSGVLADERVAWHAAWSAERWAAAETAALALLE